MTNEQFKAMLLDELENWERAHELAVKDGAEETVLYTQKQIEKINKKLKF